MRITDNILFNNFLYNINKINEKTYTTNSQMSSGKKLLDLSSDPISLSKVLSLKDINMRFDQYITNIASANSILDAEDTSLSNADDLIHRASSLLIKGANSTNNDEASRTAISEELDSIIEELGNSANTIFQGKYLFSGFKTDTQPIQDKTQEVAVIDTGGGYNMEAEIAPVYKDINQLESGNYTIHIKDGRLSLKDSTGGAVPIDGNSKDESDVGGNVLANSIDISDKKDTWIDLGRGVRIKLSDVGSTYDIDISYKSGGNNIYMGDEGVRDVEYSDGLASPVTITAKDIYKPTNQAIESNNYLFDKTTGNYITKETELSDITLNEALSNVALQTGYKIEISGSDHNGNLINGVLSIVSGMSVNDMINKIESLDSTEELENNKVLVTSGGTLADASSTLSALNLVHGSSTVTFSGMNHSGTTINISYAVSGGTTLGNMAPFISNNFSAYVTTEHGRIVIKDNKSGESKLKVSAQTKDGKNPLFGYFFESSKGGSGGLKDMVEGKVENGHIILEDKRPSESKFNLSFTIKDSSDTVQPNIFGVFNIKTLGKGIDVFRELSDASYALKHPNENNQIGMPTHWSGGTTMLPTISGTYLGGINDKWTAKVIEGSDDLSVDGATSRILVTNNKNETVATVDIANDGGKYDIQVKNKEGILIYNVKGASDLNSIVVETEQASNNFSKQDEGVNGKPGVTLGFDSGGLTEVFKEGDSFSFNLSNSIENAIGKSEEALNQILSARSIVGARTNRMSLAGERINSVKISNSKTISELEDANMADVFSDYKRNLVIMQALLNVGSKLTSHNLFDYI